MMLTLFDASMSSEGEAMGGATDVKLLHIVLSGCRFVDKYRLDSPLMLWNRVKGDEWPIIRMRIFFELERNYATLNVI